MNKKNLFQGGDAVLMQIIFIGVGEACDTEYPNTSLLVELNNGGGVCHILLDCGFTTPHGYFKSCGGPDQLAALWVSHFHGDHFFGAPLLLLRLWEMGRKSPLVILGQEGTREKISQAMELAYPGFLGKLEYPLEFVVVEPGGVVEAAGVRWQVAENVHSQRALAVRVDHDRKALFYSGDGRPTDATLELARGCGLVVHEAFQVDREMQGHGSVRECLEFAEKSGVNNLALVHMQRGQRNLSRDAIQEMLRLSGRHVFLPEPGDVFVL